MRRTLFATTAIAALLAGNAFAQNATDIQTNQQAQTGQAQTNQAQQSQQQITVLPGDTLVIERQQANMPVNLQFELRESGQSAAAAGEQAGQIQPTDQGQQGAVDQQTTAATDQQDDAEIAAQSGGGLTQQGGQQTAANQGQAGGREHVVTDGSVILVEGDRDDVELNIRFRTAAGQDVVAETRAPQDPGVDRTTTAAVDRNEMQAVQSQQIRVENLVGSNVYGANEENIGNVGDVVLSPDGEVDAVVVDVGGFLGIGTHQVAIGMDNLQIMSDEGATGSWHVFTPFTQEQLENQPEYDEATYAEQRNQQRLSAQ